MPRELAEKIRYLRDKVLSLSREEFAFLLNLKLRTIEDYEWGSKEPGPCLQRLLIALEERPEETKSVLLERPEPLSEAIDFSAIVSDLKRKLRLSYQQLASFLNVTEASVTAWLRGENPDRCQQLILWLLQRFSDQAIQDWPLVLQMFSRPEVDLITADRIKTLRKSFGVTQREFGSFFHLSPNIVSDWERGVFKPSWCSNLLLRLLELFPSDVFDLLSKVPWGGQKVTPERALAIRMAFNVTQEDFARFLGTVTQTITDFEARGTLGQRRECETLLYKLLESYPDEIVTLIQALPNARFMKVDGTRNI